MHLAPLIHDLAIILGVAALVTLVFQRIKQPVVLGYIIAGFIVGPHTPPYSFVSDLPNIQVLAELGVIFLMFSLGLEFSFRKLTRVGVSAGITACFEVVFMCTLGFITGKLLHWNTMDSIFLGAMLSISSTTIIIKALDELGLKTRKWAEIIFGVLIVEDLVAILILVGLSTLASSQGFSALSLLISTIKLVLVMGGWFLAGYFLVPRFVKYVGKVGSDEMLTVLAMGLCLALVVVAAHFNYSVALGAFIMGSILAESTESHRIEELIKPLRDIFAAIFFVSVGMLMGPSQIWQYRGTIVVVTIVTIIGKIISTSLGALISGQSLKTSVQVGFGLAQIGEFSFIIAALGLTLKVTSDFVYPIAVAVSLVTTFTTPYLIRVSYRFVKWLETRLPGPINDMLIRYSAWNETRRALKTTAPDFHTRLLRWILNGILVTIVSVLVAERGLPFLQSYLGQRAVAYTVGWAITMLLTAPFIWAMFNSFRRYQPRYKDGEERRTQNTSGTAIIFQIQTVVWLAFLSLAYFPVIYVGVVSIVFGAFLFTRLYRNLEASYSWFEKEFLTTFKAHTKTKKPLDIYRHLAPWDAHLVRIKVHPEAEISGKKIQDVQLRKRFGLNVVAIQRGSKAIVAPAPEQQIFPQDELLVLGTDDQVDGARSVIEKPPGYIDRLMPIDGYELRRLFVGPISPLLGSTIRTSNVREKYGAMVVGIERDGRRIMNPDSDLPLEKEDTVLIVGEAQKLDNLLRALGTERRSES